MKLLKKRGIRREKHRLSKSMFSRKAVRESFETIAVKHGSYSAAAVILVIVIAVVVNLICGQLPSSLRQVDISSNKIYEISDTSRKLLKNLEYEIEITAITESDSMDERLETFLDKYTGLSDKVTLETIDPVLHPSVLTEYNTEADTLIIECQETGLSAQVAFSDILVESASYYSTGSGTLSSFDGEGQLTAAISQVIGQETKKLYYLTDHGETELPDSITSLMQKGGITTEGWSLLMNSEIPEDCDILLLNGPTADISKAEFKTLKQYIKNGGSVVILLSEQGPESGYLTKLMKSYGIQQQKGYIADMERCYQGNYYSVFPNVTATGDLLSGLDTGMVLMVNSRGFSLEESSEEIELSALLETSSNSYAVTESGETQGTFELAARAVYTAESDSEEDADGVTTGNLIVYGSSSMIDESITGAFTGLDNQTLFMNSITAALGEEDNLSIEAKSLDIQYNMVQYGGYISVMLIFIVPILVLIIGFVFWIRRRRV